jgi:hypothetical protein|tara:strand:+ start:630 stop:1595 length:966 start_codon:yes stop_codon:yes gene_type:complete
MIFEQQTDLMGNHFWLPDLSKVISQRLSKPSKLLSDKHCAKSIGDSVLRQLDEGHEQTGGLRLSQSGTCVKQLAYQYHHAEGNGMQIDAASKIAFVIGDITESILVSALMEGFEQSGLGHLYCAGADQETVHLPVAIKDGYTASIAGHPDGSMQIMTQDNKPVSCILEVKSMSDYGFKKFRKEGLGPKDSYYSQVQAYMASKGFSWTYVVAYSKSAGAKDAEILENGEWHPVSAIYGQWIPFDQEHVFHIKEKFRSVILSSDPEQIDRPYGPDKKGRLSFPCDYCKYYKTCFPFAEEQAVESKWLNKSTKIKVYTGEQNDQ